jgi:recombinational DNA repair protein (RecF pathway)
MSINREEIILRAMSREIPFVMTRQRMKEAGNEEEYEGYRAFGLHECAHCHTDINETWEYDCIAYPAHKEGYPGFICGRCYERNKRSGINKEQLKKINDLVDEIDLRECALECLKCSEVARESVKPTLLAEIEKLKAELKELGYEE